jgi:hypothetical protein
VAREYLQLADYAVDERVFRPAIELLFSAAELAVTAMMLLTAMEGSLGSRNPHSHRQDWLGQFTQLGNAPTGFHEALSRLWRLRPTARYAESDFALDLEEMQSLSASIRDLVEHAQIRCGTGH